ncbi:MAG: TonB-dependent receptor [Alteromonadaceae bacterium]|nr:TonB-dependent receptor [Alteromonadaceae bacterium]
MKLKLNKLNLAIKLCLASSVMISAHAMSQESETNNKKEADIEISQENTKNKRNDEEMETIIVSGTRSSLRESAHIKRMANNFKEVITIEDIGQLPDDSIAASLQRLTGVGVVEDRGQPMQVLVRGLSSDLTLTTFNGREVASEQGGRGVSLGLFPGEILRRASIEKTTNASMIEGGMAGTVNLETARPLEVQKRILSVNAKYIRLDVPEGPVVERNGKTASLTYIDKFNNDTLGFSGAIAYQSRPSASQAIFNPSSVPTGPIWQRDINTPKGFGDLNGDGTTDFYNKNNFQQADAFVNESLGGSFTLQWQASEDTLFTFDSVFSRSEREGKMSRVDFIYIGPTRYTDVMTSDDDIGSAYTQAGNPINGALVTSYDLTGGSPRFSGSDLTEYYDSTILGLNVEHYINDDWIVDADVSYSSAGRRGYLSVAKIMSKGQAWNYELDNNDVPLFTDFGFGMDPENPNPNVILPENLVWGTATNAGEFSPVTLNYLKNYQDDELASVKLGASRFFDDGIITSVKFGTRLSKRTKSKSRETELFETKAAFSPDGNVADSIATAQQFTYDEFPFGEFMPGVAGLTQWPVLDANGILESRFGNQKIEREDKDEDGLPDVWQSDLFVETYDVDESSFSAFVQVDFEGELFDMPFRGDMGVRYVRTETTARSAIPEYTIETDENGNVIEVEIKDFTRDYATVATTTNYDNFLPSLNMVLEPIDDLLVRFAVGKAMSRPLFSKLGKTTELKKTTNDDGDTDDLVLLTGKTGNAGLTAIESTQVDLALEWYPTPDLSLSAGVFVKKVDGFLVSGQREMVLESTTGVPVTFLIEEPQNEKDNSTITGIELSYSQAFTFLPGILSGLGMTANYTHLSSDIDNEFNRIYLDGDSATPAGTSCFIEEPEASGRICSNFALPPNGFAEHTVNTVLYYDSYPVNVRLAYRYQTESSSLGENLTNAIKLDPVQSIDLSAHYSFTPSFMVSFSVNNLTDEVRRKYWVDPWGTDSVRATNRYQTHGRQFSLFARYKF